MSFIKSFELRVKREVERLLSKRERIMVAVSGGKDSATILYLLSKWGYNVIAVIIDLGFKHYKKHVSNVRVLCEELGVELFVVDAVKEVGSVRRLQLINGKSNCYTCGVIKRWLLNRKAKELRVDKLVTGHNLDDYAESVLMNVLMNNHQACLSLGPVAGVISSDLFVQRVKPLSYISEGDILTYAKLKGFRISYDPCPYSSDAFRREVMDLMRLSGFNFSNIVKYFERLKPLIVSKFSRKGLLRECVICGEASKGVVCKACQLIGRSH